MQLFLKFLFRATAPQTHDSLSVQGKSKITMNKPYNSAIRQILLSSAILEDRLWIYSRSGIGPKFLGPNPARVLRFKKAGPKNYLQQTGWTWSIKFRFFFTKKLIRTTQEMKQNRTHPKLRIFVIFWHPFIPSNRRKLW